VGAKVKPVANLFVQGRYSFKTREDPDSVTLTGEYDQVKKLFKIKYKPVEIISLLIRYQNSIRKNRDIETKAESHGLLSHFTFRPYERLGITLYFNLLDRDYQNFETDYQTSNRTYGSTIDLKIMESLKLRSGATYLDIGRDLDIDKYSYSINLKYEFIESYVAEVGFKRLGYEDLIESENDFDANVFKISVSKSIN
jgi:hypothetical protein